MHVAAVLKTLVSGGRKVLIVAICLLIPVAAVLKTLVSLGVENSINRYHMPSDDSSCCFLPGFIMDYG